MKIRIRSISLKVALVYMMLTIINLALVCMIVYENQIDLITQNTKLRVTELTVDIIHSIDTLSENNISTSITRDDLLKEIAALINPKTTDYAIFDEEGTVLLQSDQKNIITSSDILSGIRSIAGRDFAGKRYYSTTDDSKYMISFYIPLKFKEFKSAILLLKLNMSEISILLSALYRQVVFIIIILSALHVIVALIVYRLVIRPLKQLHENSRQIATGNLSARVSLSQDDEIGDLGLSFNSMASSIQDKINALIRQKKVMEDELTVAGGVQKIIFPALDEDQRFSYGVFHKPFNDVSGDYYDSFPVEGGRTGFLIVDVCGHGVPAALLTMLVKQVFKQHAYSNPDPSKLLRLVNSEISSILGASSDSIYFTAFYGVIDENNRLSYSKAGHLQQYLVEKNGNRLRELSTGGFIIGISEEMNFLFETKVVQLSAGDKVIFLTDGIVEAANSEKEVYGDKRFELSVVRNSHLDAEQFVKSLVNDLAEFTDIAALKDDATVFVIELKGVTGGSR